MTCKGVTCIMKMEILNLGLLQRSFEAPFHILIRIPCNRVIEDIIIKIKREKRVVVVTTHDMAQAERLADFMVTMKEGKINEP